jgi:Tol biopolymer transport system component
MHRSPLFLPDGKTVLFVGKHVTNTSPAGLYSVSLDGTREKRILENVSNVSYANERLLFVRNENLFAQRFNPRLLTVSGTPVAIADHVEYHASRLLANFSSSRGALVYVPTAQTPRQIVVYDRAGTATPIGAPPAHDRVLDVSPDGRRVAVLTSEWKDADISLIDMDRASRSRLTFHHGVSATAAFSPDGKQVACSSFDGGGTKIFLQSLGSNASEAILEFPSWLTIHGWSADGKYLLVSIQNKGTRFDAGFVDIANRKIVLVAHGPANEALPTLSPNQKWLAYASDESGASQIYVTRFPSGAGKWQATVDGGLHPRWSQDGKELFYVYQNRLHRVAVHETSVPEFGTPQPLFTMPMDVVGPNGGGYAITPGGRFVTVRPAAEAPPRTVHLITNWTKLLPQE